MGPDNWETLNIKFEKILNSCKTRRMAIKTVEEAKKLLLKFKNEDFKKKTFFSSFQTYLKIVFKFSLKTSMKKQDFVMIRQAIHALWLVIDYGNLCQRKFLLQKMTTTLDAYVSTSVDGNFHFGKEFLRLYTGLISASPEEARNVASMRFKNYKNLGQILKGSHDMEIQSLIAEVLLKLYLKKGFDVLLPDIIPDLPENFIQEENLNQPNELYHCVKRTLKPRGIPKPTSNTIILNSHVSIDGCLLIGEELGDENLIKFNRQNKTISFFCASAFFKKFYNLESFCVTTSWEVLSFSAQDVESFGYTVKPISQTLQMELTIPFNSFNLFLEESIEKKSNITVSISPDERAHHILKNTVFKEFFQQFSSTAQECSFQDREENIVESPVIQERRKPKHSRSDHFSLCKSLSPLSMKEPQVFLKRSALTNLSQDKTEKKKISIVGNESENSSLSRLRERKLRLSTAVEDAEDFAINLDTSNQLNNSSLHLGLYNDSVSKKSLSKVKEWLRVNPVGPNLENTNIADSPHSEFLFVVPTLPIKAEVVKTEYSENVTFSETSSKLPLERRIAGYLKQECTTSYETQNVCNSEELYNMLKEVENGVISTKWSICSNNGDFINQNNLKNSATMSQQNISNSCSLHSNDSFSELIDDYPAAGTICKSKDIDNIDDCPQKLPDRPNSKMKSTIVFDLEEYDRTSDESNTVRASAGKRKLEDLPDVSNDTLLNGKPKKSKIYFGDNLNSCSLHSKDSFSEVMNDNHVFGTISKSKDFDNMDDYAQKLPDRPSSKIKSTIVFDLEEDDRASNESNTVTKKRQLKEVPDVSFDISSNAKSKKNKISTADMSSVMNQNENETVNRQAVVKYKDSKFLTVNHVSSDCDSLKSMSISAEDLNNNSLDLNSKMSILKRSRLTSTSQEECSNYAKHTQLQNKSPIVMLDRISLENYCDNSEKVCGKTSQTQGNFLKDLGLEIKSHQSKLSVLTSNEREIKNNEDDLVCLNTKLSETVCPDLHDRTALDDDCLSRNALKDKKTFLEASKHTNHSGTFISRPSPKIDENSAEIDSLVDNNIEKKTDFIEKARETAVLKNPIDKKLSQNKNYSSTYSNSKLLNLQTEKSEKSSKNLQNNAFKENKISTTKIKKLDSVLETKNLRILKRVCTFSETKKSSKKKKEDIVSVSKCSSSNIKGQDDLKLVNKSTSLRHSVNETVSLVEDTSLPFKNLKNLVVDIVPLNLGKKDMAEDDSSTDFKHAKPRSKSRDKLPNDSANQQIDILKEDQSSRMKAADTVPTTRVLYKENIKTQSSTKIQNLSRDNQEKKDFPSASELTSDLISTKRNLANEAISYDYLKNGVTTDAFFVDSQHTEITKLKKNDMIPTHSSANLQGDLVGNDSFDFITTCNLQTPETLHKRPKKKSITKTKNLSKAKKKKKLPAASSVDVITRNEESSKFVKRCKSSTNQRNESAFFAKKDDFPYTISDLIPDNAISFKSSRNIIEESSLRNPRNSISSVNNDDSIITASRHTRRQLYKENDDTFVSFPGENLVWDSSEKCSIYNIEQRTITTTYKTLDKQKGDVDSYKKCNAAIQDFIKTQKINGQLELKSQQPFQLSSDDSFTPLSILAKNQRDTLKLQKETKKRQVPDSSSKINIISDVIVRTNDELLDLVFRAAIKGIRETPQAQLFENRYARSLYELLHQVFN